MERRFRSGSNAELNSWAPKSPRKKSGLSRELRRKEPAAPPRATTSRAALVQTLSFCNRMDSVSLPRTAVMTLQLRSRGGSRSMTVPPPECQEVHNLPKEIRTWGELPMQREKRVGIGPEFASGCSRVPSASEGRHSLQRLGTWPAKLCRPAVSRPIAHRVSPSRLRAASSSAFSVPLAPTCCQPSSAQVVGNSIAGSYEH